MQLSSHSVITPMDLKLVAAASGVVLIAWMWNRRRARTNPGVMLYATIWVQYFFGIHALISGSTFFLHPEAQMQMDHPLAGPFQHYMTAMGLFAVIKAVEVFTGLCLVLNVFVPVALLLEMPISFNIFYLSNFVVADPRTVWTGPRELLMNLFLLAAYGGYLLPLLKARVQQKPLWRKS